MKRILIAGALCAALSSLLHDGTPALAGAGDNTARQYCYYYLHKSRVTGDSYWLRRYRACLKDWGG